MNTPQAHSNGTPMLPLIFPDELITEILSLLTVKSLVRLKCVSKSWNTLISDSIFVKMHIKQSSRNPHLALISDLADDRSVVTTFPLRHLLDNTSIPSADDDPHFRLKDNDCYRFVGSCNGLICLIGCSLTTDYRENWLCFWNPATRSMSEKLGFFAHDRKCLFGSFKFTFGYHNSTDTYKVVAWTRNDEVRVFSLGDNVWRNIQSFPVFVFPFDQVVTTPYIRPSLNNNGVLLSGTVNWLAIENRFSYDCLAITVDQFVIISLDLGTETYTLFLPPLGFDEVPPVEPSVVVLMDCLCFSHDFKGTHFVIWQMTEFGVEESWTQFLKISYTNLQIDYDLGDWEERFRLFMFPLRLSENGDTLILACNQEEQAIIYNWRDNKVERTRITNKIMWLLAKDHVESLVSTC